MFARSRISRCEYVLARAGKWRCITSRPVSNGSSKRREMIDVDVWQDDVKHPIMARYRRSAARIDDPCWKGSKQKNCRVRSPDVFGCYCDCDNGTKYFGRHRVQVLGCDISTNAVFQLKCRMSSQQVLNRQLSTLLRFDWIGLSPAPLGISNFIVIG